METQIQTIQQSRAAENAALIRRGYEAFNKADMETLTEIFDENVNWHTPGQSSIAGDYKGRMATFTQFGRYGGETKGTFRANLKQLFTSEDGRVIGLHQNTAERNGRKLDVMCCIVFELRDGKLIDGREFFYDLHAWDKFWS